MMVPFDASASQQQQPTSVAPPPLPRPPMAPGHQQGPSSGMPPQHHHQQPMNPPFHPVMHHRPSTSMPPGAQSFSIPPLSPGSRQGSFNSMPSGGHQGQYPLHSPAHQPQQPPQHGMHPSQLHHSGSQSSSHRAHTQQRMAMQQPRTSQHESIRSSSSGGRPQQYVNPNLNGNWQSDKDMPHRREMIQHIVKMLKKDKNGSPDWLNKLPSMAKQLEVSLYRQARSFEAYMDMSTLKQRLQQIAIEVSRKARNQGENRDERQRHDRQPQLQPPSFPNGSHSGSPSSAFAATQGSSSHQPIPGRQVVKMDEINPMVGGGPPPINGQDMMRQPNSSGYMGSLGAPNDRVNSTHRNSSNAPALSQNSQDPEWKVRIRHKQQRLLLLHHSAKCPHEDGRCTVTPHCADMKRLWRHMEACKDNNCRIPHCFSSRAILSHYRKCKDPSCPACGPVRETVRKSQQTRGTSSRGSSIMRPPSTGPVMSSLMGGRGMSSSGQNQPQGISLMSSDDPLASPPGASSFGASSSVAPSSFHQPVSHPAIPPASHPPLQSSSHPAMPPSSHSSMPPPSSVPPGSNSTAYSVSSSQYRTQNGGGAPNGVSQPIYNVSDNLMPDPRMTVARNDVTPSSSAGRQVPPTLPGASANRNDTEWQKVRHKQQRLLLLRHASRCQYEAGKCPVTPHCASMKTLWEHIAHCKNQQCTVQHCMSSRYVLSHYRRCKDARCPACGPVRETIRKSQEKDRGRPPQGSSSFSGEDNRQSDGLSIGQENQLSGSMNLDSLSPTPPEAYPADRPTDAFQNELQSDSFEPEQQLDSYQTEMQPEPFQPLDSYQPESKRIKTEHRPSTSSNGSATVPSQNLSSAALGQIPDEKPASITIPLDQPEITSSGKVASKEAHTRSSEDHSLLNSFTIAELETHISALNRTVLLPPAKLKSRCLEVLKGLQAHQHGWVFNTPVDPVELGLPDYFEIIKKPMDLGTIHRKIDNGSYHSIEDFQVDVNLTFDNAMTYNEEGSVVHDMAKELKAKFEVDYAKLVEVLDSEDRERRQNERACTLCGCEKLLFEPPVFFCSGVNCQSTRIRRNSHFYVGGNNQYYWCNTCYNELDGNVPIEFGDMTITKADLKKKKNDEVHEESWVQCDSCERWIHQICGLFNTRQNKEHHSEYCCPKCLLDKKQTESFINPPRPLGAIDLPRTKLSEFLEEHIDKLIGAKKRSLAEEKAESEKTSIEEAIRGIEVGGPIIVRQVTAMERKLEVRERMKKRYAYKKYPDEFPYRCKCILVFQNLDGVDVVLFALYVYEHGEDNPPPNQRAVYISYLDSVHFMRPRQIRTFIYHEILIAYLDYARRKGFATAHIWACPPLKGDDYIFYAKPEDQKTPRDSRLRQWYLDMLTDCQKRNIVGRVTNMYDLYFADESLDAAAVPYLEGDYFPGEAENIIKDLEEGGGKKKNGASGKKTKKKQSKSKSCRGTRSSGVDEEALIASGILEGARTLEELDRDQVMVKLGETIQPMKESFIVAFLNWAGAKEADLVVPEAIAKYRSEHPSEQSGDLSGNKRKADRDPLDRTSSCDESGRPVKVIDDDKEDMDCEFFNNRQAFLNLCRGNHYQFDELRRAKHTSMMVLWHLHNRDAPKFVQQCVACNREILSGKRYHCATCPDYDLCETCFNDPSANRGTCSHQLQPIAVETEANNENQSSGLTEAQRLQRQRNLMLHIQLIEHASRCSSSGCQSNNCAKMKNYLQHARTCRTKVTGGCKICKRIWTLLRIHAQKCKDTVCPIPQCMAIREKMRQLQKQQQAMDDRRRQEMNRHYRMSISGAG